MLDSKLRPLIDSPLNAFAGVMAARGINANIITLAGFAFSLCAFAALAIQEYGGALFFIVLSRLADGLDGSVARASEKGATDRGAYFDILSDFIFYAGAVFFFAVGRPETALPAAFLIFSFIGTATSFLAYAIIAAKRGLEHRTEKSFHYAAGLCEGAETIAFLVLICLFPDWFAKLALAFGLLCWITAAGRALRAAKEFE